MHCSQIMGPLSLQLPVSLSQQRLGICWQPSASGAARGAKRHKGWDGRGPNGAAANQRIINERRKYHAKSEVES
jgi:hypothetical protein